MWNQLQPPGPVPPSTTDPNQAPGQSRGLLALVREYLGGWLGPRLAPESRAGVEIASEKVHSGPAQVILPWFLPYFDDYTAEPAAARAAYRRMFADPNVKSALLGKLLAVGALDLKIRPADKKDPWDLQIAEFVKWTLVERVRDGFPGLIWSVLSGGLIDGYSVCEKVFEQEEGGEWDGQWPLVAVKPKDVGNDLVLQTDSYRNVVGVMGLRYNAGQEFSPARFLLWRHLPLYDTPTGMSDLRAVYSRYWLLDTVLKLRGVNAEKRAIPFLMGTYTNPTQQRSLENTLAQVKSQAWVTVPEGVRVEALNIAGSADSVFEGFIRDLKHDIFMGIQGAILQALEGSVSDGRGNSQVHRSTADLLVWYIAQTMQSLLNDRTCGLIKDIVDLNFVVQRYPRASLSAVDVGEMTAELDIDTKLFGMGIELSKEDMYERYNRVPPLNEADALKKDAGGPGGMPGMPGSPPGGGGLPSGGDDPAGGDDDGIDPPEGGDYDPAEDDDGLFDEPNLFTAPMRQFGEWEEDKHPRGEDGKFGGGSSGKAKAGSSEVKKQFKAARREARAERPADAKAARQQVKERRAKVEAAKKAIVEHAENSFDLEQELGQLAFRGPAVNRVLDRLSLTYPDEKTVRGREVPKGSVDRLDDFRALAQAATNAQASYKKPKSGDEAEDFDKVQALMSKVKDYADQGVAMYRDAVKVKRGGKDRPASSQQPAAKAPAPASKPAEPAPWERNLAALASKYDVDYGDLDNLASTLPGEIAASKGHAKKALEKKLGAVKGFIRDRDAMRRQDAESFAEQPDEDTIKLALVYLAAELAKGTITEEEYDEAIANLLNGPEEFAEEDWSQQATKTGGVKWVNKTSGRVVYGKENPGKSKRKAKGKEEDTTTKEKKPAAKGKAAGPVGLEQARKLLDGATDLDTLAGTLAGLHNSDLQALKKELKVTAGGVKAEQAKAAARAALAAVKGAGPAKPEPTKPEPKAKLKPEPKKPEPGKGKVADEAQTWGSFLDAVGEREKAGGLLKIPELFDSLKKTSPDLTQEQFHDLLKKWQDEDKLVLQVANDPHFEPRAGEGIKDADGYTRLYVELGPKAEKELGQRKQSKPAVPAEPPPPPTPPPSPPAGGGEGPEKGGAPRALSFLKPPEGAPSAEAIQAHADAHKALARLKENKADSWSPYTPMLDRKIKQQQAALAEIQKKNPGLKSDEPGFSGIDALGRRWQDGKLVPREETRKAFDAIGQLQKTIVGRHKDHEVNRNPQVFDDLARQGLMKRSSIGGYELTSEGARALVEAYNDDPAGPTTHRGVQAYIAAYGSLPIEEKMAMAKHLGVPPNKSHPNMYPFFTDFEKSLRESTAERINEPIGPRLEKLKEQAAADIQALASMDRVKSAEVEKDVADVLRKRVKDPARVSVRHGPDVTPRSQKAMDRGASLLQGVIGRTSANLEGIESYQAIKPDGKPNNRPHAKREDRKINAPPGMLATIAIHEIAHYLEDDPEILAASQAFLRHRTRGEKEVYLKELFPEYDYGPTEKARKDNFDKVFGKRSGYYAGKDYGETATEIISMGMEYLFRNPAEFAAKDPEYTAFLLGILDGSIRGKPIPKE